MVVAKRLTLPATVLSAAVTLQLVLRESFALPFGMADTNFSRPEFKAGAFPIRVISDSKGGLLWSFANRMPFDGAGGQRIGGLLRADESGTLDASFALGPTLRDCLGTAIQADGKILVGATLAGDLAPNDAPYYRVFRVTTNGVIDSAYASPAFDGVPRFMTLQPDGNLIVGGVSGTGPQAGNGGILHTPERFHF